MPAGDALEERIAAWRGSGEASPVPVVIAGSVTRDLVHRQGRTTAQIGGTVWYAGLTLSRLGFPVRAVTRLAAGDSEIAAALAEAGIEARIAPSKATTVFHNIYGGGGRDDRRQVVEAVAAAIAGDALAAAVEPGGLCYLGPLHPDDLSAEAVAVAAGLEATPVAVDVQGYTRRIVEDRVEAALAPGLAEVLNFADVVKAGAGEACLIAGAATPADAAVRLAEGRETTEVLVTDGARGVHLAIGGKIHRQPAPALADVDPTGAGDIFLAAYLAGRLIGEPPESALRLAVEHAAGRLADPTGRRRLAV
ncbi:MAG: PfkB family carbohydrate kinase [Alphaproteobacteria bacterium]|jgi:sugar/nucleoside kinase (ribokinase family)|nr:PfkB family carbohydrate kinase [Alphaproteobacteria bacterium]